MQCDVSSLGIGAAILQDTNILAYASRALTPTEQGYAQIEKELLAVVFALRKFDHYTYGRSVKVERDHKPLQIIMKKPLLDAPKRLQRMLLQLQRYDIDLIYKPGKEMFLADTLSRAFSPSAKYEEQDKLEKELEVVCALEDTQLQDMILDEIVQATHTDPTLRAVKELIQHGWPHQRQLVPEQARSYYNIKEDLTIENDIIMKNSYGLTRPQILVFGNHQPKRQETFQSDAFGKTKSC